MSSLRSIDCAKRDVLLCNAGSTTLKLQRRSLDEGKAILELQYAGSPEEQVDSLSAVLAQSMPPLAVVHRIVHAGAVTEQAQLIDNALIEQISHWSALAPMHNPLAISLIEELRRKWPELPQFAIFDSGLYAELPAHAAHYALPATLSPRWPLRRYGFHGLAHRNQWRQVRAASIDAGLTHPLRLISLHLGGGCSLSAWQDGRVIDTSMGFTPLEGLMMATRSGSIDPGILLHLLQQEGMSAKDLSVLLSANSGLASSTVADGDVRQLLQADTPEANELLVLYCYQIRKAIGAAVAVLGGLDAISIGGGVGEHQALIRQWVLGDLAAFGVILDEQSNREAQGLRKLHMPESRVALWLTPVNEFEEMFRQCESLVVTLMENRA